MSICSIEDVGGAIENPFWFQLYLMRDRGFNEALIERAREARCSALMVTLDLPFAAVRRRDPKNGLSIPPRLTLSNALDIGTKPAWAFGVLRGKRRTLGNLDGRIPAATRLKTLSEWVNSQFDPTVTWKDIEWVRQRWPGKLILKGVLDAADVAPACATGADAIVVSNHGGRQLDGACSTIRALPEVVEAVAGRCEVLFDGGVQCGQDIFRALALGARACLIGKSFLYGLGALGQPGVRKALQILSEELRVTLALTGANDVKTVNAGMLRTRPDARRMHVDAALRPVS
jgi:L-lactate dehydrogenase (cytochrome)